MRRITLKFHNRFTSFWVAFMLLLFVSCSSPQKALKVLDYPQGEARIVYVYDPLCGWCFAFKSVMNDFKKKYDQEIPFEIMSGGMIIGEPKDSIGKLKDFFAQSIPNLEENTAVKFGEGFKASIEKGTELFSSEKPSIALIVYKSMGGKDPFTFASNIQHNLYYHGIGTEGMAGYHALLQKEGLDTTEFDRRIQDSLYIKKTWKDFAIARGLGANGYPTVFYVSASGKLSKLTDGYTSLEELEKAYKKVKP